MSGRAASVPDHDCAAGACVPGVPDGSFDVFASCGGV